MAKTEVRGSFGKPEFYSGGGGIPEGNYALEFETKLQHPEQGKQGEPRLVMQIYFTPLEGGDKLEWRYSMGQGAHKSWMPTQDGKGITPKINGEGKPLPQQTNWQLFLDSLYNSGLPEGTFDDDVSVLDGVWVHIKPTKPPESRKGFGSGNAQTSEAGAATTPQNQRDFDIGMVTEILADGAPWEGGGGIPAASEAPAKSNGKAGKATTAAPKVAAKAAGKKAAVDYSSLDAGTAAITAVGEVLNKNPQGCSKLILRTGAFKWIKDNVSDEIAQEAQNDILMNDEELGAILGMVDFKLEGGKVISA